MSNKETSKSGNGIGFGTILFFIFLVLKLAGVIAWSWWWVTAPIWIPAAVLLLLAGGALFVTKVIKR